MTKRSFMSDAHALLDLVGKADNAVNDYKKARRELNDTLANADVTFYFAGINKHEACFIDEQKRDAFLVELRKLHGDDRLFDECKITSRDVNTFDAKLSADKIKALLRSDSAADQLFMLDVAERCHDKSVTVCCLLIDADDTMDWPGWRQHGFTKRHERDAFLEQIMNALGGESSLLWQKAITRLAIEKGDIDMHAFKHMRYKTIIASPNNADAIKRDQEYLVRMIKKTWGGVPSPCPPDMIEDESEDESEEGEGGAPPSN